MDVQQHPFVVREVAITGASPYAGLPITDDRYRPALRPVDRWRLVQTVAAAKPQRVVEKFNGVDALGVERWEPQDVVPVAALVEFLYAFGVFLQPPVANDS